MRYVILVLSVVLWPCGAPKALCGNVVVVESTTSALEVGQLLDDSQPVTVPQGSSVTLIGEDGTIIRLEGPYTGAAAQSASTVRNPELVGTISRLVRDEMADGISLGGIRRADLAGTPGVNEIDVSRSSRHCLIPGQPVSLWRAKGVRSSSFVIRDSVTNSTTAVRFGDGAATTPWPADLDLRDNSTYWLWDEHQASAKTLTLRLLVTHRSRDLGEVARLAEMGCTRQARALLKELLDKE